MGGAWRPGGYPISQGIWTLFSFASSFFLVAVEYLIFIAGFFYTRRSVVCRGDPRPKRGAWGSKIRANPKHKKNFLLSIFLAWVTPVTDSTWSETPKSEVLARSEQN